MDPRSTSADTSPTTQAQPELGYRFQVQEHMFSLGKDYFVENEKGERVYWIDAKVLNLPKTILFRDMQGNEKYRMTEKMLRVRGTMTLYKPDGSEAATIHKALIRLLWNRYSIHIPGSSTLETQGDILNHEYVIVKNGAPVVQISREWFRIQNTYGVQVTPGTLDPLLALAMCIGIERLQGVR
jgi:uncharacterized protein YxjI